MCVDRILTGEQKIQAYELSLKENSRNAPAVPRMPGMSNHPLKMALLAGKMWKKGRVLRVGFLDGSQTQRQRVMARTSVWMKFANIRFQPASSVSSADIRISFKADPGSWSYVGTDNLGIDKGEPTMNFGWLENDTDDQEYDRVVLHEFGHALGCIHEHQNPKGGIKWNLSAVYAYFGGPPNNWSREDTYQNVIKKYSVLQLNASRFDRNSIMLYSFPGQLIKGGVGTSSNDELSAGDKSYIAGMYPLQAGAISAFPAFEGAHIH
jgi:hypothetical protein